MAGHSHNWGRQALRGPGLVALAASVCLWSCQLAGPAGPAKLDDKTLKNNSPVQTLPTGPRQSAQPGSGEVAQIITGRVLLSKNASGQFRTLALTQVPVPEAEVKLYPFARSASLAGGPAKADADGRFKLGSTRPGEALFLRASAKIGDRWVSVDAPVPLSDAPEVQVDIDLSSTMLVQMIFDRAKDPAAAQVLLKPENLAALKKELEASLSDEQVPDIGAPTAIYQHLEQLKQNNEALRKVFSQVEEQLPAVATPTPLPAPTTFVPPGATPGPTTDDPPIYTGTGSQVTGQPKPASYLDAGFTKLQQPGMLALRRWQVVDDVFMTAIDHADGSLFAFFRDTGNPTHLSKAQTTVEAPKAIALDAEGHIYLLGSGKLVRLTIALAGGIPSVTKAEGLASGLSQGTALAVSNDGASAYLGGSDGRVTRYALPAGTLDSGFSAQLPKGVAALACGADGAIYALQAESGTISKLSATGQVTAGELAKVAGGTSLAVTANGHLFIGSAGKEVFRLAPGGTPGSFMKTADPVTGTAIVGGYLYLVQGSGNLDSLTYGD